MAENSARADGWRDGFDASRYADLLGEPPLVPDPRITTAQASKILQVPPNRVRYLAGRGWLTPRGAKRNLRPYLLSEVDRLTAVVTIAEAAQIAELEAGRLLVLLRRRNHRLPDEAGDLTEVRLVDALLATALWAPTGGPGPVGPLPGPPGTIGTAEAAKRLGMGREWLRLLARHGRVRGAVRDANGCWYFRPDELEVLPSEFERRARDTLGVVGAARMLQLAPKTVRAMAEDGRLPAERDETGRLRFRPAQLRLVQVALATGGSPPYNFFTRLGAGLPRRTGPVDDRSEPTTEHR